MIDPVLEEQSGSVGDAVRLLENMAGMLDEARRTKTAGDEAERAFKTAREEFTGRLAALLDGLEISPREGEEIVEAMGRIGSLGVAAAMSEIQWRRFADARGAAEMRLRGLAGVLDGRRRHMAAIRRSRLITRQVLLSWPLKLAYLTAAILIVFAVLEAIVV
ncbi:MAG: hypothetical protein PHN82_06545 [bacterium]|nr:hypothetical protein [bacterium]